jgi:hypothetical protein
MLFIELICWAGLLFIFWTWKGQFRQPGSEAQAAPGCGNKATLYEQGGDVQILQNSEPIGRYRDMPIYHHVLIEGKLYRFESIAWETGSKNPVCGKRRVPPGLIYEECRQQDLPRTD